MLKREFCRAKIKEYKGIVENLKDKESEWLKGRYEHARELLKAYEIEYAKALQRDEPPLGINRLDIHRKTHV